MIKKKSLSALILTLALFIAAAFTCYAHGVVASAEQAPAPKFMTTVNSGFILSDDGTEITGFDLPAGTEGFFEVEIPEGPTSIGAYAFAGTKANGTTDARLANDLIRVVIPASVQYIEQNAFGGCVGLIEVCTANTELANRTMGLNSAPSIVSSKDKGTLGLSDGNEFIVARNGGETSAKWLIVKYIGEGKEVTLPSADKIGGATCKEYSVYNYAFADSEVTSVAFADCVTSVGEYAFARSAKLEKVTLNEKITTIGASAFLETNISSVSFPKTLTTIENSAFSGCANLSEVKFAEGSGKITVKINAFSGCTSLKVVNLPEKAEIMQYAFDGCSSLLWVYTGSNNTFVNTANGEDDSAVFFPKNNNINIVFPDKTAYETALNEESTDKTFLNNNGASATYLVTIKYTVGGAEKPAEKRLHGHAFNYVCDSKTGLWNTENSRTDLPAQAANYSSTVWYGSSELKPEEKVTLADVNAKLAGDVAVIDLFCHATVEEPVLPAEPVSWVQSDKISYDIKDLSAVLKAMGVTKELSADELAALNFTVVYADEKGNVKDTPATISGNGVYSVTVTLNPEYGVWTKPLTSSVTVNVNTGSFNIVLIVFLVIGALAIAATVSTAIIRKKVQAKAKKKQLSSQEVLEKFRANGGETNLK